MAIRWNQSLFDAKGVSDLGHINIANGIGTDPMGGTEVAGGTSVRSSPSGQNPSVRVKHADASGLICFSDSMTESALPNTPPQFGNIDQTIAIYEKARRALYIGPLVKELAVRGEDLDSVVLPIGDQHPTISSNPNIMRKMKLTGTGPWFSPGLYKLSIG